MAPHWYCTELVSTSHHSIEWGGRSTPAIFKFAQYRLPQYTDFLVPSYCLFAEYDKLSATIECAPFRSTIICNRLS
ncbi:MAG: hypothetical protein KatS3mg040_0096 [Candidatus Kapaibacterium sp.]|nr:MAG: hypothetical protein KatS3mg040_0096 [Candidatus Kapabacteria bacterium]